ncbi:hypothetical protein [Flavobacterium sp. JP2137]|uniref:hypothetical protein n=1 Tax=Flavobacterium sp. JP2137 TaxID=3414510 RepID=UPI003D2FB192
MKIITYNHINKEPRITIGVNQCLKQLVNGDNPLYRGSHFSTKVESGISAIVTDNVYKEDAVVKYAAMDSEHIGIYFFYTDRHLDFRIDDSFHIDENQSYHTMLVDLGLPLSYRVAKQTAVFSVNISMEKQLLSAYFREILFPNLTMDAIQDTETKSLIYNNYISEQSLILLEEFRAIAKNHPFYELFLKGIVYALIKDFVINMQGQNYYIQNN